MIWLLGIVTTIWLVSLIDAWMGLRRLPALQAVVPGQHQEKVSVIIAARNEEGAIAATLQALLQQTYEHIEVIVVNDRSTDATGAIIAETAHRHPHLQAVHLTELPAGWLGKNHALYQGYRAAQGEYLLFTDADILFAPGAISKAITYMKQEQADHLTVSPELQAKGLWLRAFISYFIFGFGVFKRPWLANQDNRKGGMGIGAFNLLRRDVYEALGTHAAIANRPDDDLRLGQIVKQQGFRQRLLTGLREVQVEWYPSLREAIKGLEKNTFAGLYYSVLFVCFALAGIFATNVLPFLTLFSEDTLVQGLSAAAILTALTLYSVTTVKMIAFPVWLVLLQPLTTFIFMYSTVRAVALTLAKGGIVWRGTFYSLTELRRQRRES